MNRRDFLAVNGAALFGTLGAGVGVTNGWGDNLGLARPGEDDKRQIIRDIQSLVRS
ncbi:MAG: hypothetical protein JW810_04965 [Sedimentisphaerales bacterium]|nr:hypothetical protein [Sedimentisphaerales bacterium]